MQRSLAPFLILLAVSAVPATAQCPFGTPPPCAPAHRAPSVAILFMEPRSRSSDDSLLAEGLTLEIINALSGMERLDVRSRWVSRRIAAGVDPIAAARSLGIDYIVDGVINVDSTRVLMRGALSRTATGRIVRSIRVERRRSDLAGLQVAVAHDVAAAVVGQLLPAERTRFAAQRVDPEAYALVARARALSGQYTAAAYRQAIALLKEAVTRDSSYAPAWSELAFSFFQYADFELPQTQELYRQANDAAIRAVKLDPSSGGALSLMAFFREYNNDAGPETEAWARRGNAMEPGVTSAEATAIVLMARGKVDDGLAVMYRSVERDSLSPVLWVGYAYRLSEAGRYANAADAFERALSLRPLASDSANAKRMRAYALIEQDCAAAARYAGASASFGLNQRILRCLGRTADADSLVRLRLADTTLIPPVRAELLLLVSQPDSAFALLDRTFPRSLARTLTRPSFTPYRQHPGYQALRHRLGLDR